MRKFENRAASKTGHSSWGRLSMSSCRALGFLALGLAAWCAVVGLASAASQAQIDQVRDRAAAWLIKNQRGDGQWSSGTGVEIPVTAQATSALVAAGVKGFPVLSAQAWLRNSNPESVDALSRVLIARALPSVSQAAALQQLVNWRNRDAENLILWGAYPRYTTSLADTALAWRARLTQPTASYAQELAAVFCNLIIGVQRSDGGWPNNVPPGVLFDQENPPATPAVAAAGSVFTTSQMVLMMRLAREKLSLSPYSCADRIDRMVDSSANAAVNWLTTSAPAGVRNGNSIGENGISTLLATAQAYQALRAAAPSHAVTHTLLDYMIGQQNVNGHWNSDPMITAVMLEAIAPIASAVFDADGDGIPDSIENAMGTNPNVADTRALADRPTGSGQPGITLPITIANQIRINVPFTRTVSVSGGTGPYSWSITAGMLPPGLALNPSSTASATISGTPTALGTYTFEYSVRDATGAVATTIGQLTVVRAASERAGTGDVNGDGKVDLADVILAQRFALGLAVPTDDKKAAADAAPAGEPDGIIDASDVLRILRKALGIDTF